MAFAAAVGVTFLVLGCALYDNWWPMFVLIFYICIVISAIGLPVVLAHVDTIDWGACALVLAGNLVVFLTILGYFFVFGNEDLDYSSWCQQKQVGLYPYLLLMISFIQGPTEAGWTVSLATPSDFLYTGPTKAGLTVFLSTPSDFLYTGPTKVGLTVFLAIVCVFVYCIYFKNALTPITT
ncbi:unnamed protein product [Mytilus coruscus]|uniref:Uncharacterized protein n=1 Tax=Mytilus coruscus TaxID=42192 RepID=A0A6J8BAA7_MYTCO|nr:unnamed protein product [Mytilus coruscus]CAC5379560.1 unnamed protein product [Mytilus coruscus]